MVGKFLFHFMLLAGFAVAAGCGPSGGRGSIPKIAELTEAEKAPLYRVTVGDETEAVLLADRAKLAVVALDGAELYFRADAAALKALAALDYQVTPADPFAAHRRVVRVAKSGDIERLQSFGVMMINEEKRYWIVSGSLGAIRALAAAGYRISPLEGDEPRPRTVAIEIDAIEAVQRIADLGVDIYSVEQPERAAGNGRELSGKAAEAARADAEARAEFASEQGLDPAKIWVIGGAFDNEIAALKRAGFAPKRLAGAP